MNLLHRNDDSDSGTKAAADERAGGDAEKFKEVAAGVGAETPSHDARPAGAETPSHNARPAGDDRASSTELDGDPAARAHGWQETETETGPPPKTTLLATLNRTRKEFSEDGLTDLAASLTYYGLLALFPGLIALVGILGIFGDPQTTTKALTDIITDLAPGSAADTFSGPIESITSNKGGAGFALVFGILAALYSASSYIGAFMRASNVIYETREGRPFWKLRPLQILVTLVMVLLLVVVIIALVMTGPVVDAVAGPLGVGDTAVTVWNIAKWPVMIFIVLVMLGVLYYSSPNVKMRKFSLITPGAILALAVWVIASVLFAFYVANFGSYDKTYGTLGGVISLLVWLWISNIAVLLGAQLNAEIERTRELKEGVDGAAVEIQLEPRDEPKPRDTD